MSCPTNRQPAGTCANCFRSLEPLKRHYRCEKGLRPEPRKTYCSTECLQKGMQPSPKASGVVYNGLRDYNERRPK